MAYLSVGGLWAVADRMGWRPLDYDPEIVFLTVAHFHYAGFVLPIVAGFVVRETKMGWQK
ncbi:MAG: YndJ family transporter [Saprospiraceae bacterium]